MSPSHRPPPGRYRTVVVALALSVVSGSGAAFLTPIVSAASTLKASTKTTAASAGPTAPGAVAPTSPAPVSGSPAAAAAAGKACAAMKGGTNVTITASCQITGNVDAGHVTISGGAVVSVADKGLTLRVRSLIAMDKGTKFLAGCPTPLTRKLTIVITEKDEKNDRMSMGAGVVGSMGGADFCLVGSYRGPGFTQPTATVEAGATSVTTKDALGVKAGEEIVFATTDRRQEHSEVVTVKDVSGDGKTLTFSPGLRAEHLCTSKSYEGDKSIDMCGDVGALDRTIEVHPVKGGVGHIMSMGAGTAQIAGVHTDRLGYTSELGRYSMHFHLKNDAPNSYLARNSCTNAASRCFVFHGTNKALMKDNVGFISKCSQYLMGEGGTETDNTFAHNLALNANPCDLEDFDKTSASGMWTMAMGNTFLDNHSAGTIGWGFHIDVKRFSKPRGVLADQPVNPSKVRPKLFKGLTVYSTLEPNPGHVCPEFACGAGLKADLDGTDANNCWPDQTNKDWKCVKEGEASAFPLYDFGKTNMLYDVTSWNNTSAGIWGFGGFGVKNARISDTRDGLWGQTVHLDDSLIVGASGVVENAPQSEQCTRMYDFKTVVSDSTFANCGTNGAKGAAIDTNGAFDDLTANNYGPSAFKNLKFDNSVPFSAHEADGAKCKINGFIAWLIGDNDGVGSGHLEFPCGAGTGVARADSSGVKLVKPKPPSNLVDGSYQHTDPNNTGIPDLPDASGGGGNTTIPGPISAAATASSKPSASSSASGTAAAGGASTGGAFNSLGWLEPLVRQHEDQLVELVGPAAAKQLKGMMSASSHAGHTS